jgi:hypothetical protein
MRTAGPDSVPAVLSQSFVTNIFFAKPSDFLKARQKVAGPHESYIDLPLVK